MLSCLRNRLFVRSPVASFSASYASRPSFNPTPSFKLTEPPTPGWNLGDGLPTDSTLGKRWKQDETQGWKTWDTNTTTGRDLYRLLTSAVVPRPIAFVSTLSADHVPNLAPMSYFNVVSHNPPLLSISLSLSPRKPKDTRENIHATKEFTVNIISEPFVEAANICSIEAPSEVDEWVVSGLTPEPSVSVKPARVKESAVNLECELYKSIDFVSESDGPPTTTLVIGLIKHIHIRNAVLTEDQKTVDPSKLRPVARLEGNSFVRLGEAFDVPRHSWKALKDSVEKIMEERK
ncbi:hypothetical protein QCA50_021085 [Cerrena zonata]|uniref:Flavin reductase like domain-containing protein n=1 Tax=Cerrena zonata TaxID=2478898 RepID=A0AAW0FFF9_9APHY